jgi:hypothetical protein
MIGITLLKCTTNVNPFTTRHLENCGVKKGAFAKEYYIEDIKKKARENKVSVNDLLMTAISMTVK